MCDVLVIAMVKGDERYIVSFSEDNRCEALRTLGRWACNPELSFTWFDAAAMRRGIKGLEVNHKGNS